MSAVYYIEINSICIVLMLLLKEQMRRQRNNLSTQKIVFNRLLWATMILCLADMVAGICRGQFFTGARAVLQISNLLFFEMLAVICFLWALYVELCIGRITRTNQNKIWLLAIPLLAFTAVALSNPFTRILFTIDESDRYVRNAGVYLHWAITWLYLLYSTLLTALTMLRETNKSKRREFAPLLYFIIAPVVAGILQMLFYGVTSTQVGITVSIIAFFLVEQNNQIATDTLTGLNNRSGLDKYILGSIQNRSVIRLSVIMIDINSFKQINDKFGHLAGDHALLNVADTLKLSCDRASKKTFLCRFGGDEFLIVGKDLSGDDIQRISRFIDDKLDSINASGCNPYALSVGIGVASGDCTDLDSAKRLIRIADESMYDDKRGTKSARRSIT